MSVHKSRKNEILRHLIKIKLFRSLYFNLTNNFFSKYKILAENTAEDLFYPPKLVININDFNEITKISKAAFKKKETDYINPQYFLSMQNYIDGSGWIFDSTYGDHIINKFHLSPGAIVAIDTVSRLIKKKKIGNGHIVDLGCGLGNLLGYLETIVDRKFLHGVDNFSQIKSDDVLKYQSKTFKFNIKRKLPSATYDMFILSESPISLFTQEINLHNPKYIFTDTLYYLKTPPHQSVTDAFKIVEFNEVFVLLEATS